MVAEAAEPAVQRGRATPSSAGAVRLGEIGGDGDGRLPLPIEEFARVLGGGIVPGSIVLIGGDPGIGKSTLLLQVALALAEQGPVLYVSGEESVRQIKGRADRLGAGPESDLRLMAETELESVLSQIEALHPGLAVIDSIQTMHDDELEPAAGSISQVRQCAARLQALAKGSGVPIFLIGHVTKDGAIAGPRVLEHLVDTVLYLEGDAQHAYRLLRAVKNRFGPTTEVGVFEMSGAGMVEVPNPSEAFLAERAVHAPGSVVSITLEGARPLLVEIQGLTSATAFGNPRRTANGVDFNRLLLMTAVLTRRLGLNLSDQDVFVNVVGGLQVDEPAADLAIAAALASSFRDRPIAADVAVVGEVGLSGELRAVPQLHVRLREASKLGFRRVVAPRSPRHEAAPPGIELIAARSLRDALDLLLSHS
jgi:DNA repair protein RadA/Sms